MIPRNHMICAPPSTSSVLEAGGALPASTVTALLPADDTKTLEAEGMTTKGAIKLKLERAGQDALITEIQEQNTTF